MRKVLFTVISAVVLLIAPSAYSPATADSLIGDDAPNFAIANDSASIELKNMRGRYVLLSFWSSTDAESRIANKAYNDFAVSGKGNSIEFVSVNFDPSTMVFKEIMKIDKLEASHLFHVASNSTSALNEQYNLRSGYMSLLINPKGEVIAQNPTTEEIQTLVNA